MQEVCDRISPISLFEHCVERLQEGAIADLITICKHFPNTSRNVINKSRIPIQDNALYRKDKPPMLLLYIPLLKPLQDILAPLQKKQTEQKNRRECHVMMKIRIKPMDPISHGFSPLP